MTPELWVNLVGIFVGGMLGGAFIKWVEGKISKKKNDAEIEKILEERDKTREEKFKEIQEFWHDEFDRQNQDIEKLNRRIDCQEKEIKSLKTDVKGRDLTIEELTAENGRIKEDYKKMEVKNAQLESRIAYLEDLLKKAGIDPNEGNHGDD